MDPLYPEEVTTEVEFLNDCRNDCQIRHGVTSYVGGFEEKKMKGPPTWTQYQTIERVGRTGEEIKENVS